MTHLYEVSVIIPVYNAEKYLKDCLDSLLFQSISQDAIEVLMVNDGSSDKSFEICYEYAKKYDNFKLLSQENQGVSAARNNGIRNAQGKYLLYLDSDDMLAPNTIEYVVRYFEEHYDEIDLVAYKTVYQYEDGTKKDHYRSKELKKTGIYDVTVQRYIHLTNLHIMTKNIDVFFREDVSFHEDEVYIAELIMKKEKFGYVKEAEYLYRQHANSVVSTKSSPYYIFEQSIRVYEDLFDMYADDNGQVPLYIQEVILNDFGWKLKADKLYPYHYSEREFEVAKTRITQLINKIDAELILNHPAIDSAHKYFFLAQKTVNRPTVTINRSYLDRKNQLMVMDENGLLRQEKNILIVLNQMKIKNGKLYVLAYLKSYVFAFLNKPKLYAVIDDVLYQEVPLFLSQHSCYWVKMQTNTFWAFHFELDLSNAKKIRFIVEIEGREFPVDYYFTERQALYPKIKRPYIENGDFMVHYKNKMFFVLDNFSSQAKNLKKEYEMYLFKNKRKQWLVRKYTKKRSNKKIWLYRDSFNSKDNAYYQFKHDFPQDDDIERYYILNKEKLDWENAFTDEEKKYLIEFGSKKHKKLFIQADKILTSFIDRHVIVPFDMTTIRYYHDLFKFEVVYLQHGVMHAKIPNMYSKEKVYMIDRIVVSTQFEKNNLENKLGYLPNDILCVGMSRLDRLKKKESKNKILFAPSWRRYLVDVDAEGFWCKKSGFEETDYFKEIQSFLMNEKLKLFLDENNYTIDIKLHPIFQIYTEIFSQMTTERIRINNDGEIGEYAVCITDFSSFLYECTYLNIPVVTHIFDIDRFKAGLHTYRELFWDMENDYPYYAKTEEEIVDFIELFAKNNQKIRLKYNQFVDDLFFSKKNNHAQQLYDCLMEV